MRKSSVFAASALACAALAASAGIEFGAGADLRIRQEMMKNVPGLPGGGLIGNAPHGRYVNNVRFRPRVWGEIKGETEDHAKFRLYTRFTDEFRWYINPSAPGAYVFPDELILDNLFLEGKGLFDGFLDFAIGRQDLYGLYEGMDLVITDGTPGDGSRTTYGDMVRVGLNFEDDRRLDLFALYNFDDADDLRWGTRRGKHRSLTGLGRAEPDMDDWGFGAIWSAKLAEALPYKFFVMQKNTASYYRMGSKRPRTQRELVGLSVTPQLDDEWSLQFDGMGQVGVNGDGDTLLGSCAYVGVNWKSSREDGARPYAKLGYLFMSGDKDTAEEDGGHSAWDPMWSRAITHSELMLYGPLYGVAWWSNMHFAKLTLGVDIAKDHSAEASCGPIFCAAQDGLGGGDGDFKGFLARARYSFPIFSAPYSEEGGRGFNVLGHFYAEVFNPGDYYSSDKLAWFLRWNVEFRF